jgi:two-component system sensor histidine kinase BaeS
MGRAGFRPARWLLLGGRFARRLTLAFAVTALAGAALTAVVVNLVFGARFGTYVDSQRQAREDQVVGLLSGQYQQAAGWQVASLDRLGSGLVMSGVDVSLLGSDGTPIWSLSKAGADPAMRAMHNQMMGVSALGPAVTRPVIVNGQQVGTALVRVPQAVVPAADAALRTSVNQALLGGALAAGVVALGAGLLIARGITARVLELTAAADELAAGHRDRRARVSSGDEIGGLAVSFNTMADAVQREEELRRGFAADIAHELRTPLSILQGHLEAVQDGVVAPEPEVIDSLHEEALRLGRLVADLETVADADAAGFTLDRHEVALAPLVADTLDGLAAHVAEAGLQMRTDLAEVGVVADPVRVRQVVTNLVTNATKFTPTGGTITVTLQVVGGHAELVVADTGVGIPAEDLPRVFERFFRGGSSTGRGSGIGLAVVAGLVAAHDGEISVTSDPGQGSRFLVRLPVIAHKSHRRFTGSP